MKKHVKQLLLLVCMLLTVSSYGQTSEVYSYVCSSKVDTGTGEKKLLNGVSHFYCRFDSNKGICYETNSAGKLKSEIYKRTSAEGYIYRFYKKENGINVYRRYYDNGYGMFEKFVYFSSDYSRMNEPLGDNEVFIYERVFPDKTGSPTQMW